MEGSQAVKPTSQEVSDSVIEAGVRNSHNTAKILDMERNEVSKKIQNKNLRRRITGLLGCLIVGFIIYNIIVNYKNLLY